MEQSTDVKSIIKFNTHLLNFINELNNIYPSIKEKTKIYNNLEFTNDKYLVLFQDKIKNCLDLLIKNDETIIECDLFENITLTDYKLTQQTVHTIVKYINIMFIQSFRYQKTKQEINNILRIKLDSTVNIDKETLAFLTSIKNLKNHKELSKVNETDMNDNIGLNQNILNQLPLDNSIMNGSIGKLAMDIAKDIDLSQIDLSNPMQMLQGIMSGNVNDNSGLQSLFGNITSKITNKLNSGDVDTENILSEAKNIMSKTKNMPFNNDLFKNLQKNMPNMPNMTNMSTDTDTPINTPMPDLTNLMSNMPDMMNLMSNMPGMANLMPNMPNNFTNDIKQELEKNNTLIEQKKQEQQLESQQPVDHESQQSVEQQQEQQEQQEQQQQQQQQKQQDIVEDVKQELLKNLKTTKKKYLKKKLKKLMKK